MIRMSPPTPLGPPFASISEPVSIVNTPAGGMAGKLPTATVIGPAAPLVTVVLIDEPSCIVMSPCGTLIVIDLPGPTIREPPSISRLPGLTFSVSDAPGATVRTAPVMRCRFSPTVTVPDTFLAAETLQVPAPSEPPNASHPGSDAAITAPVPTATMSDAASIPAEISAAGRRHR